MNRLKIILKENHTLHEMMLGIIAANVVLAVVALFADDRNSALTAVLIGAATALIFVIHMAVTVDYALCLDEKGAISQMRTQMLIRYLFVAIVVGSSLYFKIANPVFLTISILTVKAGAYLQPSVHKLINRRWDK